MGRDCSDRRLCLRRENSKRFVMICKIKSPPPRWASPLDTRESREASVSRRTASETRAGDWNNLGIDSVGRGAEGEEVNSWRGLRTMRGGARLKQTSWPGIWVFRPVFYADLMRLTVWAEDAL
jgi:hypothetical protein